MPKNTVKDLRERRGVAVKRVNEIHEKLSGDVSGEERAKLNAEFNERMSEIDSLDGDIKRFAQVEALQDATDDGPGNETRTFNGKTEDDDPIANLDSNKYSLLRAVSCVAEGRKVDGYEGEISQELEQRFGKKANGFCVPYNLRMDAGLRMGGTERRDLDTTAGAGALPTVQSPSMIELLRNRVVLRQLGATVLADMVGTFDIPKETGEPTFSWVAESAAGSQADGSIGKVTFTQKTVTAWTVLSRRFRLQTSIDAENFARMQLMKGLAVALDYGGIAGPGTANNVTGLINNTSTNLVSIGTNGGALTWAKVVEFESSVAADNADFGTMGYLANAVTRGSMKTIEKASGTARFLWEGNEVNGYAATVSNQLPSNLTKGSGTNLSAAVFGDFSQLVMALWGGADVLADPYTGGTAGDMRLIIHQDCDIQNRHDEAFARCVDIVT